MGIFGPKVIEADAIYTKNLIIRDGDGKIRAFLGVNDEGQSFLELDDKGGRRRAYLGLPADGPAKLTLYDEGGKVVIIIGGVRDAPSIMLFDKNGKPRCCVSADQEDGRIDVYGAEGRNTLTVSAWASGSGIQCRNEGKVALEIGANESPFIKLLQDEKLGFGVILSETGEPVTLKLKDGKVVSD